MEKAGIEPHVCRSQGGPLNYEANYVVIQTETFAAGCTATINQFPIIKGLFTIINVAPPYDMLWHKNENNNKKPPLNATSFTKCIIILIHVTQMDQNDDLSAL